MQSFIMPCTVTVCRVSEGVKLLDRLNKCLFSVTTGDWCSNKTRFSGSWSPEVTPHGLWTYVHICTRETFSELPLADRFDESNWAWNVLKWPPYIYIYIYIYIYKPFWFLVTTHLSGHDLHFSRTIGKNMETDLRGPQGMNPHDFGDPMTNIFN